MKKTIATILTILLTSTICLATQYVMQIEDSTKILIKSYTVSEDSPVRESVPKGRTQIVTENATLFNKVEAQYINNWDTKFEYKEGELTW